MVSPTLIRSHIHHPKGPVLPAYASNGLLVRLVLFAGQGALQSLVIPVLFAVQESRESLVHPVP